MQCLGTCLGKITTCSPCQLCRKIIKGEYICGILMITANRIPDRTL